MNQRNSKDDKKSKEYHIVRAENFASVWLGNKEEMINDFENFNIGTERSSQRSIEKRERKLNIPRIPQLPRTRDLNIPTNARGENKIYSNKCNVAKDFFTSDIKKLRNREHDTNPRVYACPFCNR